MTRTHVREVVLDSSHFTPLQLNTRFVMQCCMNGWAGWARDYLTPFHKLIRDEGFGIAVIDSHVSWKSRFGFFDTDTVEVRTSIGIRRDAQLLRADVRIHGQGREVVRSVVLMRPLRLADATLAAQPGAAVGSIIERFQPDEVVDTPPQDRVDTIVADISARGEAVAQGWRSFRIHRADSEASDQWSFTEIPGYAAASREELVLSGAHPALDGSLACGISSVDVKLTRPLFVFDLARVETTAFQTGGSLSFIHRIKSVSAAGQEHALIVERLVPPTP